MTVNDKKLKEKYIHDKLTLLGLFKKRVNGYNLYYIDNLISDFEFSIHFRLYRKWQCDYLDISPEFSNLSVRIKDKLGKIFISLYSVQYVYDVFMLKGVKLKPLIYEDITKPDYNKSFNWEEFASTCIEEVRNLKNKLPLNYDEDELLGLPLASWNAIDMTTKPPTFRFVTDE